MLTCTHVHRYAALHLQDQPSPSSDWLTGLSLTFKYSNKYKIKPISSSPIIMWSASLSFDSVQSQMLRNDGNFPFSPKFTRRAEQRVRGTVPSSFDFRRLRPAWLWSKCRPPLYPGGSPQLPEGSLQLLQNHLLCLFTSSIKIHGYSPTSQQRGLCSKISVLVP